MNDISAEFISPDIGDPVIPVIAMVPDATEERLEAANPSDGMAGTADDVWAAAICAHRSFCPDMEFNTCSDPFHATGCV
jgi:hypothetical protein